MNTHEWRAGLGLLGVGSFIQVVIGREDLLLPVPSPGATVSVISGLLVGHGAMSALWSTTPWWVWSPLLSGRRVFAALAAAVLAVVLTAAVVVERLTATPTVVGWMGATALAWIGLAVTRQLSIAWVVPLGLTMAGLIAQLPSRPLPLGGLSIVQWYEIGGSRQTVLVPAVGLIVAIVSCSIVLPRREAVS